LNEPLSLPTYISEYLNTNQLRYTIYTGYKQVPFEARLLDFCFKKNLDNQDPSVIVNEWLNDINNIDYAEMPYCNDIIVLNMKIYVKYLLTKPLFIDMVEELIEISILDPDLINSLKVSDIVNTEIYLFLIKLHGDNKNYFNEILNSIRQLHTLHESIPIDNIIDAYAFNFFDAAKTDRYLNDHPELSRSSWADPISHYYSSEGGKKLIANGKRAIAILRKHLDIDRKNDLKAFTAMVLAGGPARGNGGGGPVYGSGGPVYGSGGPVSGPVSGIANKPPTKLVKSCPVCTFDNDVGTMVCSQCGTSLADVVPGPPQAGGKRRKTTRFTTKRRSNKGKTQKRLKRF
jgi:hypothetical protein